WPGATVELSDDPQQATEELQDLFARDEELVAQRRSNIRHMLQRHDWRDRIRQMCRLFEWSVPPALDEDLGRVRALAAQFA
ncbi:MAG: glycosyltransferase family 1 protein, partial [Burkholderiales bacterium]